MKKMWRWTPYSLEEIEIVKETTQRVTFKVPGRHDPATENKRTEYQNWFDTKEQALLYAISLAENKVAGLRSQLDRAETELLKRYADLNAQ